MESLSHLKAGFQDPDVDEEMGVYDAREHVKLIIDLPSVDLVEELHKYT